MINQTIYHKPVLLNEVLYYLEPKDNGIYVDATFGSGGHTQAILETNTTCKVIALDFDKNAIDINGPRLLEQFPDRFSLIFGNFSNITHLLKKEGITKVDGILADFGTSQFQINELDGFSFHSDTPLDMRMSSGHFKIKASDVLNRASENELTHIFFEFGQEPLSRKVAREIVKYRKEEARFKTTGQLVSVISRVILPHSRKIHPATKIFQALRIYVNDELNNIKSLLSKSVDLLNLDGRLVLISFHSLEDRLVKYFIKENKKSLKNLTPKVIIASEEELETNPSCRSAKLRAAERIN